MVGQHIVFGVCYCRSQTGLKISCQQDVKASATSIFLGLALRPLDALGLIHIKLLYFSLVQGTCSTKSTDTAKLDVQ